MAFNTTSFFAGVGTVFAAIILGFAGGAMITTQPKMEPNRLERVASHTPPAENAPVTPGAPTTSSAPAAQSTPVPSAPIRASTETPANLSAPAAQASTQTTPVPERAIAMTPATAAPESAPPQAPASSTPSTTVTQQSPPARSQAVTAREDRDDSGVQVDRRKFREGGLRRAREQRPQRFDRQPSEARNNERSKRQEIEAAANAVRQMKRDGILEDASPREEAPHFVLFGNDND